MLIDPPNVPSGFAVIENPPTGIETDIPLPMNTPGTVAFVAGFSLASPLICWSVLA
jgi:hypothetical protein